MWVTGNLRVLFVRDTKFWGGMADIKHKEAMALWKRALIHIKKADPKALDWARSVGPHTWERIDSKTFLESYCFVVYASGMKYETVSGLFPKLREAFKDFDLDSLKKMKSISAPMKVFSLERKARNFLDGAHDIAEEGFDEFKAIVTKGGMDVLERLPGIGPITKKHLAKNIGLADVVKNDRWLVKAAKLAGWKYPEDLVEFLAEETGESRHVIDVAIWNLAKDGKL